MNTNVDQLYMIRALKLATYGQGLVEPNPMVGCVIAHEDYSSENALVEDESHESHIVGEGWHQKYGEARTEINALAGSRRARRRRDDVCYLGTLLSYRQAPPCVDAIIEAGISRVVVAMIDPCPEVAGSGVEKLKRRN